MIEIIKAILMPSQFAIMLGVFGIGVHFLSRWRKLSIMLVSAGFAIYVLFSFGPVAALLLGPLEYRFPPLQSVASHPGVNRVVVLGAYSAADTTMPQSTWPNSNAMFRIVETYHIYRARPDVTVFIIGHERDVVVMSQLLVQFGVPANQIVIDDRAKHTRDSAISLADTLGDAPFFLVTSAGHMPRAVNSFRYEGLQAIPAPTDYQVPRDLGRASLTFSAKHLYISDLAIREYGGIAWYHLTNEMRSPGPT